MHGISKSNFGPEDDKISINFCHEGLLKIGYIIKQIGLVSYLVTDTVVTKKVTLAQTLDHAKLLTGELAPSVNAPIDDVENLATIVSEDENSTRLYIQKLFSKRAVTIQGSNLTWGSPDSNLTVVNNANSGSTRGFINRVIIVSASLAGTHTTIGTILPTAIVSSSINGNHIAPLTGTINLPIIVSAVVAGNQPIVGSINDSIVISAGGSGSHIAPINGSIAKQIIVSPSIIGIHSIAGTSSISIVALSSISGRHGVLGTISKTIIVTGIVDGEVENNGPPDGTEWVTDGGEQVVDNGEDVYAEV